MTDKEAFEACYPSARQFWSNESGNYADDLASTRWEAWQASTREQRLDDEGRNAARLGWIVANCEIAVIAADGSGEKWVIEDMSEIDAYLSKAHRDRSAPPPDERAAFETWWYSPRTEQAKDEYMAGADSYSRFAAWEAWQARASLAPSAPSGAIPPVAPEGKV